MCPCNRTKRLGRLGGDLHLILCFALGVLICFSAQAQIQQAWVARYNNGITNGTNQAVKMALDAVGNIYVTGFSQNASTNLGYATIKYAPNGNQLWAARYDSTNYPTASPTGLALDNSNNVVVTGSALTVKYDSNGNQLWTAPFAGAALASDTNGDAYVTGFWTNFNTVKLNQTGSNVWEATYSDVGSTVGEAITVDSSGNVYVAGSDAYLYFFNNYFWQYYFQSLVVKFDANGNQIWKATQGPGPEPYTVQVEGAALDSANNLYVMLDFPDFEPYVTLKYAFNGSEIWASSDPTANGGSVAHGIALDAIGNAFVTGADAHYYPNTPYPIGTYKIGTNGAYVWTNLYYSIVIASSVGTSICVDLANAVYLTGYSPGTNSHNDIVTVKYDQNGNQIWVQRYAGLGNGNDAGNAIAVDNNGNVYVAGYDTTTAGGTEMVLIKYSPVSVQRRADGTVLLEAQGSPGESFDIQASTDLLNWLDLGSVLADTNGLMQFDDTNAPICPARFYYTSPQ
jgi:hypothetical protein